jgi:hypothetical protein
MERKSKHSVGEDRTGFRASAAPAGPPDGTDWGDDWVHELIAMTRPGVEIEFPARDINDRAVPFVYDDFR